MSYNYKRLPPFKFFVLQNFPFIEADFDAINEYQLLCKVAGEIKKIIATVNMSGEQVEALSKAVDDVYSYLDNLDVQEEINQKLDDMAEDGTLAEIINQEIFETLNQQIQNAITDVENLSLQVNTQPYYNVLSNGGHADGINANDSIFSEAYSQGNKKFYFSQNEDDNAVYFFTNTPDLHDCEIIADDGVVLSFPNLSSIDNTKDVILNSNVLIESREQNRWFIANKNKIDMINQISMPNYDMKNCKTRRLNQSSLKMFTFNYNTGEYVDNTTNKSTYYQTNNYSIRYKASSGFSLLTVPLDKTKPECVEIVTTPNTHIAWGCLNSSTLHGIYSIYNGQADGQYYPVVGTASPQVTTDYTRKSNIFNHNGRYGANNNFALPIKFKLRNDPDNEHIQLFVNDVFAHSIPWGGQIDNFGFGIYETSTPNISSDNGFSEPLQYIQEHVPINSALKILIAGDSRTAGYNSFYKIEKILDNMLKNNGVRPIITNISEAGLTIQQIKSAIQNQNLSNYDIVIVSTGINNYNTDYTTILQNSYDIMLHCQNNNVFCIIPATMPTGYGGTDSLANARTQEYYKVQQAILSAVRLY